MTQQTKGAPALHGHFIYPPTQVSISRRDSRVSTPRVQMTMARIAGLILTRVSPKTKKRLLSLCGIGVDFVAKEMHTKCDALHVVGTLLLNHVALRRLLSAYQIFVLFRPFMCQVRVTNLPDALQRDTGPLPGKVPGRNSKRRNDTQSSGP